MGRELRRVPINFQWEINKLWSGFVNPHKIHECSHCKGIGYSEDYEALKNEWYGYHKETRINNPFRDGSTYNSSAWKHNLTQGDVDVLVSEERLWDFTRVPLNYEQRQIVEERMKNGENSWLPFSNGYTPTCEEVNEWSIKGFGHDSINCSIVIKARLEKIGKSHLCPHCNGIGEDWQHEKAKELYEGWVNYDPPTGDGFQLWTTTSEGSPMTPVFETLDLLCEYCERENISKFGRFTATKQEWMEMLNDGLVIHKQGNMIFI